MKKSIALVAMVFGGSSAFAQDLTSKKGEPFLPVAKDIAISIDAYPIISTMGNLMSDNGEKKVKGTGGATNYIMAKYFLDEKTAFRAVLGLNFGSTTTITMVNQVGGLATAFVEDSEKESYNSITIGGGLEKRRGSTRLQGYYGGMLLFSLGGSRTTNTYGDPLSLTNAGPRQTLAINGSTFGLNVNGFVGAEYFVLPKVSIGAEYWWGIGLNSTGKSSTTTERVNINGSIETTILEGTVSNSSFGFNGQYGNAALFINLHF